MKVDIHIGKPIAPKPTPRDMYVVTMIAMHGDGNYYEDVEASFKSEHLDMLKEFLLFLKKLDNKEVCEEDDEYRIWFCAGNAKDIDEDDPRLEHSIWWPGDMTCDRSNAASLCGYEVCYYDQNGVQHQVNFSFKQ